MKYDKKRIVFFLLVLMPVLSFAVPRPKPMKHICDRVEPAFWWTDMNNSILQVMFYGEDIGKTKPSVNPKFNVKIERIERTDNPDYIFLYLDLKDAKPGVFQIDFGYMSRVYHVNYELKQRNPGSRYRTGFDESDAFYLLMPDRFANGNPDNDSIENFAQGVVLDDLHQRQGGDIEGIINHLDYLQKLGITALWTTPLLEDDDVNYSYHHYSTTNFYKVDARFGTNDDFRRLVDECHKHDIKYIMDIVPNHVNPRHWWNADLPAKDWYHNWESFTRTNYQISAATDPHASVADKKNLQQGWFDTNMADLNLDNSLLFDYITQSYIFWAEFTGLDGFRVDTYPYNDINRVASLLKAIRNEYPNINIVGECWVKSVPENAYYQSGNLNRDGFDSQLASVMDFMLKDYFEAAFVEEESWNTGLIRFYSHFAQDFAYANPDMIMNMLNNHDMNRFSNAVHRDPQLFKMGLALLAVVRGYPQYYYGDEIMLEGEPGSYEGSRHRFPGGWPSDDYNAFDLDKQNSQHKEIFNYLSAILNFRKSSEALTKGKMIQFIPRDGIYVFFRFTDNQKVMVVVNNNSVDKSVDMSRFNEMDIIGRPVMDIVSNKKSVVGQNMSFPAKTVSVFEVLNK